MLGWWRGGHKGHRNARLVGNKQVMKSIKSEMKEKKYEALGHQVVGVEKRDICVGCSECVQGRQTRRHTNEDMVSCLARYLLTMESVEVKYK